MISHTKILIIFIIVLSTKFLYTQNIIRKDTSPSFKVKGEWIEKNDKRFFLRIIHYFYVNELQEYKNLQDQSDPDSSFKSLVKNFNVIIHPWWLLFVAQGDFLKLGLHTSENPAFNLKHPKPKYSELESNQDAVLMTPLNAIRKILRNAGLDSFGMSSGYFNKYNPVKTIKTHNQWVMGPEDMNTVAYHDSFASYFGNNSVWGFYQNEVIGNLMQGRGEYFWGITDEPDKNGHDWFFAKEPLEKINQSITHELNNIVFQTLSPTWNGNKYLFSIEFPNLIPPNDLNDYKRKDFLFSYGDTFEGYKKNLTRTINYYKNTGNVFGINDYVLILKNPEYAGYFVDWIKSETNNAPVIIWIAPYQIEASYDLHKCQMFTAIVHGANGIGFWLQETKEYKYDKQLLRAVRLSREIERYEKIVTADPVYDFMNGKKWIKWKNDIHYTIRELQKDKYSIIAVNTSKSKKILFNPKINLPGIELIEINIKPLEVIIF